MHLPCLGVLLGMRTADVCGHPVLESVHLFSVPSPHSSLVGSEAELVRIGKELWSDSRITRATATCPLDFTNQF